MKHTSVASLLALAYEEGIHHACSIMEFATAKGKTHRIIPVAVCRITTEIRRNAKQLSKERYASPIQAPK